MTCRRDIPRARFWIWVNGGPVKLTVQQGKHLLWEGGGPTEEGARYMEYTWILDGALVTEFKHYEESDCDGYIQSYTRRSCSIFRLREYEGDGTHYPEWQTEDTRYRDHSAERMGY
jgi:hypothetical protein